MSEADPLKPYVQLSRTADGKWRAVLRCPASGDETTGYGATEAEALQTIVEALVEEALNERELHVCRLKELGQQHAVVREILASVEDPDRLRHAAKDDKPLN